MKQKLRSEIKKEDTWDLEVIYKNIDEFMKDYNSLKEEQNKILDYKGRLLESGKTLLEFYEFSEKIERKLYKLYYYAHLNFDADTTNTKYQELVGMISKLMTDISSLTSFVDPELLKGDYDTILKFYEEEPKLLKYKFNLECLYRYKKHVLSEEEEKILSTLGESLGASEDIYEALTDSDLTFPNIKVDNEEIEFTESNYPTFIESHDRSVRKQAFDILFNTYSKYKNTIGNTFKYNVETNEKIANIRNYNSVLESCLYGDNIDVSVYDNLIKTVRNNLNTLYSYYDLKKEVLGLKEMHLYDVYAPMVKEIDKKYSFLDAKKIVLEGLSVLGEDYHQKLERAFNERFIDIYNNKGKRGGAYSSGFYDTNPYILLNFEGKYNDVTTLAHELGHSMHSLYSWENNPFNTSSYHIFVAEVASTVNELILVKYLLKKTDDKNEKLFLLNKLLELFKGTIFRQTMFSEFEKKMYEKNSEGVILTNEYLSLEYYKLVKDYFGENVICDDLIKYEWMRIPHFYYDFYVYKYAIGLSAACKIVHDIETLGKEAVDKYIAFLKTGGSMFPADELKVAGVDISSPKFIEEAIAMFKETIEEFKEIYRK